MPLNIVEERINKQKYKILNFSRNIASWITWIVEEKWSNMQVDLGSLKYVKLKFQKEKIEYKEKGNIQKDNRQSIFQID